MAHRSCDLFHTSRPPEDCTAPVAPSAPILDVSVVIVNYNVRDFLEQAIRSIYRAATRLTVEILVVDNASSDGSMEMVAERFPAVRRLENAENVGFGRANNQAIQVARGRYILVLNPDTIVQEDTLEQLCQLMDNRPDVGAAGCMILNPDGSFALESRRSFPGAFTAVFRMLGLSRLFPKSKVFGRYNLTYLPIWEEAEIDALSGSCMFVRASALTSVGPVPRPALREEGAGLFDEDFFMYGEDLDWCFRIQQAGWRIMYTPSTQIIHYKGESTKRGEMRYVRLFYGAMLIFADKHFQGTYATFYRLLLRIGILLRASLSASFRLGQFLRRPAIDAGIVASSVLAAGYAWSQLTEWTMPQLFVVSIPPMAAVLSVGGMVLTGAYHTIQPRRIAATLRGLMGGFVMLALLSYAFKEIAFSRVVVALGFTLSLTLLLASRVVLNLRNLGPLRALVVGPPDRRDHLEHLLAINPRASYQIVDSLALPDGGSDPTDQLLTKIRDTVRWNRVQTIIFVQSHVDTTAMFAIMMQLRDLPVLFKVYSPEGAHIIGKSAVDKLILPDLAPSDHVARPVRSPLEHRCADLLLLSALYPVRLLAFILKPVLAPSHPWYHLGPKLRGLGDVLLGRMALVGAPDEHLGNTVRQWGIRRGRFSVVDYAEDRSLPEDSLRQAYWYYATHQSIGLDLAIILRILRNQPAG